MQITLNGVAKEISETVTLGELVEKEGLGFSETRLINGFSKDDATLLLAGDDVLLLEMDKLPTKALYERLWSARYGKDYFEKLQNTKVCICGVGGLGSHIALSLARLGIGKLCLIDKDVVDMTNLGRQSYEVSDLGQPKVFAMKALIERITPLVQVEAIYDELNDTNYDTYLKNYPYVMEAFDSATNKANLTEFILATYPDTVLLGASGMSGIGEPNRITTKKVFSNYYLSGDGESDMGLGLLAPRVMLCAAHQATMLLNLILENKENDDD